MAAAKFSWFNFSLRLIFAVIVVFATYNPDWWSYVRWVREDFPHPSVLQGFVGVVLLIGWAILLRATVRSLGAFGIALAVAFFALLIWLVVDWGNIPADNLRVMSYIIQLVIVGVLAAGVSWSHVRRRISGQVDADDVSDDQ